MMVMALYDDSNFSFPAYMNYIILVNASISIWSINYLLYSISGIPLPYKYMNKWLVTTLPPICVYSSLPNDLFVVAVFIANIQITVTYFQLPTQIYKH